MNCPNYAPVMIERFKSWHGRIGALCDECDNQKCYHNPKLLTEQGVKNGYGCLILEGLK